MKVVKDELLDNRMKESGIFLIWAGRPIMMALYKFPATIRVSQCCSFAVVNAT